MRKIVVFLVFLVSFSLFAENYKYGIIKDARGYTEVKESGNSSAKIRAKLKNNTFVYIEKTEGEWVKISSRTEYYDNGKYLESVDGYIMKDKLSYEFGPAIYMGVTTDCDSTTAEKLIMKNKMNYEDFGVIVYYLENGMTGYDGHGYSYSVKPDPAAEFTSILKISNGLELKISEDYESFISELKYKKINIDSEKDTVLGEFVPDTSVSGINNIKILENKARTYIKIPSETKGEGCSIEAKDRVFIFKDNKLNLSFDMISENISNTREFNKWIKVKIEK